MGSRAGTGSDCWIWILLCRPGAGAVLLEVGMERFGKKESCSPPWYCYSGNVPKRDTVVISVCLWESYTGMLLGLGGLKPF